MFDDRAYLDLRDELMQKLKGWILQRKQF
jgi:hypothetical protein